MILVLQVIQQNSSKRKKVLYLCVCKTLFSDGYSLACLLRSSIELNNQVFSGSYATSQKCGKHGSQANIDETYIL